MCTTQDKKIRRIAWLNFFNVHKFPDILEDIHKKGYSDICLAITNETGKGWDVIRKYAQKAEELGLGIVGFNVYIKDIGYVKENPCTRMVVMAQGVTIDDLDRVPTVWGCPFNQQFLKRYLEIERKFASLPAVREMYINDEASMLKGSCYCNVCVNDFKKDFNIEPPTKEDWDNPLWKDWVIWRFERWDHVHKEIKDAIKEINPEIEVTFQTSPGIDLVGVNPWQTAINLAEMAEYLDSLSTDPYHYFHSQALAFPKNHHYISEWSRFLAGASGNKPYTIITQGFNAPSFSAPIEEKDGYIMGIVPHATGASRSTAFTYELMSYTPAMKTFEETFKLDKYFEETEPLKYAGVVHGFQTEVWKENMPDENGNNYDTLYFRPVCTALRFDGIPYAHIWDCKIDYKELAKYKCVVLPQINCLSNEQSISIENYFNKGGGLIGIGDFDRFDQEGEEKETKTAQKIFGIKLSGKTLKGIYTLKKSCEHEIFNDLSRGAEKYGEEYILAIDNPQEINVVSKNSMVLATLVDSNGHDTGLPGVVINQDDRHKSAYFTGIPLDGLRRQDQFRYIKDFSHTPRMLANAVLWTAGAKPLMRITNFPPLTKYKIARPKMDKRIFPTIEFFPMTGERYSLLCVASYMAEEMELNFEIDIPASKKVAGIKEMITKEEISFSEKNDVISFSSKLKSNEAIKVYLVIF